MKIKVKSKQPNSKMCFVCGLKNIMGLQGTFYELENNELLAIFKPLQEHQGYPNVVHGGIATAMLDETIGRAIMIKCSNNYWGVTAEIKTRFKKPLPIDKEIRVIGRITNEKGRMFEGEGKILLSDGTTAVEGYGKYIKIPFEKIGFDVIQEEWKVTNTENDPVEIELN